MNNQTEVRQAEAQQAKELFDITVMKEFLYDHAYEYVGDRNGVRTTLIEEVGEVAKLLYRGYIKDGRNYYRKSAFLDAELTTQEREQRSERCYLAATKKLLFLNSVCKLMQGEGFIIQRINKDDPETCERLGETFAWCVQHYAEL